MPRLEFETPDGVESIIARYVSRNEGEYIVCHYPDAPDWDKEDPDPRYEEYRTRIPVERVIRVDETAY